MRACADHPLLALGHRSGEDRAIRHTRRSLGRSREGRFLGRSRCRVVLPAELARQARLPGQRADSPAGTGAAGAEPRLASGPRGRRGVRAPQQARSPVPRQGQRGAGADLRPDLPRLRRHPGVPGHLQRGRQPARSAPGPARGQGGGDLSGGHYHQGPRGLAEALLHRGGEAGTGERRAGAADRPLGHAGHLERLHQEVPPAAPQDRGAPGRQPGGPRGAAAAARLERAAA